MLHKIHLLSEIKRFLLRWLTAHKYLSSAKILYNYRQNKSIYKLFTGTSSGCAFLLLLMFQRVDRCLLYPTKADSGDHIGSPLRMSVSKYGFHRALTASEHALFCPVFVGATLRGRPSMGNISFQCRPRRHVSLDKLKENRYNKSR